MYSSEILIFRFKFLKRDDFEMRGMILKYVHSSPTSIYPHVGSVVVCGI